MRFLEYKADGKQVVKINRFHLDRDENAAKNILNEGLKIIGTGLSDNTSGEGIRPEIQAYSAKLEAHLSLANHNKINITSSSLMMW